jgi:hypothetical protein
MDAYQNGFNGKEAALAAKKYYSHRVLPPEWWEDLGRMSLYHFRFLEHCLWNYIAISQPIVFIFGLYIPNTISDNAMDADFVLHLLLTHTTFVCVLVS